MILEVRTYDLHPRKTAEAEARLATACADRSEFSPLAASFHTEIGPLNQVIQIWPYRDHQHRRETEFSARATGSWPPDLDDLLVSETREIFQPLAISPEIPVGDHGPFFEIRRYRCTRDALEKMIQAWNVALPERLKWGPLVGVWHSESAEDQGEVEDVRQFLHIWPYKSLDQRHSLRATLRTTGMWPPPQAASKLGLPDFELIHQQNQIVVASAFSPLY